MTIALVFVALALLVLALFVVVTWQTLAEHRARLDALEDHVARTTGDGR